MTEERLKQQREFIDTLISHLPEYETTLVSTEFGDMCILKLKQQKNLNMKEETEFILLQATVDFRKEEMIGQKRWLLRLDDPTKKDFLKLQEKVYLYEEAVENLQQWSKTGDSKEVTVKSSSLIGKLSKKGADEMREQINELRKERERNKLR